MLSAPVLASVRPLPRRTRMVTYGRHEAAIRRHICAAGGATRAQRGARNGDVLAITSAIAQEGKTTTAANLAVAVARRGTRVVLADFDFRKASVGRPLPDPESPHGMLQVMAGTASLEDVIWTVSLEGRAPRVSAERGPARDDRSDGNERGPSDPRARSTSCPPAGCCRPERCPSARG